MNAFAVARLFRGGGFCSLQQKIPASEEAGYSSGDISTTLTLEFL
jgi:hypothetical protein